MLIWPLRMLGMILAQAQRAVASSQRVHEVLVAEPQVVDAPHAVKLPEPPTDRAAGEVRFEDVDVRLPRGPARPVLDGLDLRVAAGRVGRAGRRRPAAASRPSPA